ncbi:MAG TPA: hypothetical protein VN767_16585 [Streptosporangiaceae bacterium]|nr:hypothetical protein [Streptosporangiaceae bacterium]
MILAGGTIIADGSADELSRRMSTKTEVRWSRDGQRFVHPGRESGSGCVGGSAARPVAGA